MRWFLAWWSIGCVAIATIYASHYNRCPDDPWADRATAIYDIITWPAALAFNIVIRDKPGCRMSTFHVEGSR